MSYSTQTDKNGIVRYKCQYNQKGQKHGIAKIFDVKGNITDEISYVNGKRNGKSKTYRDNEERKIIDYKNNKKHGMDVYIENGVQIISSTWVNGKKHGPETYHRTDTIYHYENNVVVKKIFDMDENIFIHHFDPVTGIHTKTQTIDKLDIAGGKESYTMEFDCIEDKMELKHEDSKYCVSNREDGSKITEMYFEDGSGFKITENQSNNTLVAEVFINGVIDKIMNKMGENTYKCSYYNQDDILTLTQIEKYTGIIDLNIILGISDPEEILDIVDYNLDGSIKK